MPTAIARTFAVSDVAPATEPLAVAPYYKAVSHFLGSPIESCSSYHGTLLALPNPAHPLIAALHEAFATHRSIVLSPDIIWLTIAQGFAHHVNMNAEGLRPKLVQHEGKIKIIVRRDDFVKSSPENPWPEVFAEFSAAIADHIGNAHGLIVSDFSTTGPVERAASEVVLLDAMHAFFDYEVRTLCGIPAITLEGTLEDWERIVARARALSVFDLAWWIDPLLPVLSQFAAAARGNVDREFWSFIYKWRDSDGSGAPWVSGWILKLFPYLNHSDKRVELWRGISTEGPPLARNEWLSRDPSHYGPGRDDFPCMPAKAPFVWEYHDQRYEMEFVGGLIGVSQAPQSLRLRPEIGWAVRHPPVTPLLTRVRQGIARGIDRFMGNL